MKKYRTNQRQNPAIRLVQTLFGEDWRVYNATLAQSLGSVHAAIFYQQCAYWSAKKKDGWFFKTIAEFQKELGLSRYEQDTAIKILLKYKLIEKRRKYMAMRYFRVTEEIIAFAQRKGLLETPKPKGEITAVQNGGNKQFLYKDYSKTIKDIAEKKNVNF